MARSERWQLGGNAPEIYERELVPAIFEPWAPLVVARATLREGERVIDVACGTGVVTRLARSGVGAKGHVVGIDLNSGMLARARASSQREGDNIEWQEGDAGELPFSKATFDAVFCQLGLQYFPDQHGRCTRNVSGPEAWRTARRAGVARNHVQPGLRSPRFGIGTAG